MSASLDLSIFEDRQFHVFDTPASAGLNKGAQKLLEYIEECMEKGQKLSMDDCTKIYFDHVALESTKWMWFKRYPAVFWDPDRKLGPTESWGRGYAWKDGVWGEHPILFDGKPLKSDSWKIESNARQWLNSCLGRLVRKGYLFPIPKGYVLKRIEE